jgi:alpha-1,2-mannosyltransferase
MGLKKIYLLLIILFYIPFLFRYGNSYIARKSGDFPSFYWAADFAFNKHISPYQPERLMQIGKTMGQEVHPYFYPPPSLLFFFPFCLVPYEYAKIAMLAANHIGILLLIYCIVARVFPINKDHYYAGLLTTFYVIYILAYYPIVVTLNHGQINIWVMLLLCVFWIALRENKKPFVAAISLSLAIILKLYPALFLILLLIRRKYSIIGWVAVILIFLSLLGGTILPSTVLGDWLAKVLLQGGYSRLPYGFYSPANPWNQSINGFTSRLFLENNYTEVLLPCRLAGLIVPYVLASAVLLLSSLIIFYSSQIAGAASIDFEISLFLLAIYLIAPYSWEHHLVFILPAVLMGITEFIHAEHLRLSHLLIVLCVFLIAWEISFGALEWRRGYWTLLISAKFYAVFALWMIYIFHMFSKLKLMAKN